MKVFENNLINEKVYKQTLENGLDIYLLPRKNISKKVIMWGTKFGAVDNDFTINGERVTVPDGIAHYLEHKMFEQRSGINALDTLTSFGVEANAFTGSTETVYLYECTNNFYEALEEFMDYVQNPYFTDENVEKERGIIEQEIMMYDDYPDSKIHYNLMKCLYHNNAIKIPVAGTVKTIADIDKDKLYKIYNTFYVPENMRMVISGDFEPDEIFEIINKYIIMKKNNNNVVRNYPSEPDSIVQEKIVEPMEVSIPSFLVGYKLEKSDEDLKKSVAIDILNEILFGKSSKFFADLYEQNLLYEPVEMSMDYDRNYAMALIEGESKNPEKTIEQIKNNIEYYKNNGIKDDIFQRIKKDIYGKYLKEYNDLGTITQRIILNAIKDEKPFEMIDNLQAIDIQYVENILNENFDITKCAYSIIEPKQ